MRLVDLLELLTYLDQNSNHFDQPFNVQFGFNFVSVFFAVVSTFLERQSSDFLSHHLLSTMFLNMDSWTV